MFHALVKDKVRRPSFDKTVGLMGYAKFPAFIVMTLIVIITPITLIGFVENVEDPGQVFGALCGTMAVVFGLGAIGILWAFWVHSHAQSVANDMSPSSAFGWLLLTWFLIGIIQLVVGFVLSIMVIGATFGM
jgi:hypothetical protein